MDPEQSWRNPGANETDITFPHLVHQLSDTDCAVPDWLAASETKLEEYKASQFNAIVKLVEARYWLGNAQQIFDRLWAWQIVFGQPRHVHRQMMSKSDAQSLASLPGPRGKYSFTTSMPQHYFEDYPDSYKLLRESSFPNGIDDAIPAFIKHYCLLGITVFKLRKRITALYRVGIISRGCKLFTKSQELIVGAESMVKNTMCMAQRWHAASKMQKEYYQLPGVDLGLSYGTKIFTEYDANKAFVVHTPVQGESGQTHWDSVGPLYTPIRWRPGSAWLDYFRNTRQDHPIMRHFDINDLKRDKGIPRDISGPYEMRIPQAIVPIWMHYARMYDGYEDGFNTVSIRLIHILNLN